MNFSAFATPTTFSAESLAAAQKSSIDTITGLSEKAFTGFEKLVELNMAASRAMVGESLGNLKALATVKDAQGFVALQSGLVQPLAEKAASYGRHLAEIVSASGADITQAFEASAAEAQKAVANLVETSMKNAPAGSEPAVALLKSAMSAGTHAVESAQKTAKQTLQAVESNLQAASIDAKKSA